MNPTVVSIRLDRIGFWLSMTCAVHCMVVPMFVLLLPFTGWAAGESLERAWLLASVGIASISFKCGVRIHRRARPWAVWCLAVGLLAGGLLLEETPWERVLSVLGALALAAAHWINHRLCLRCSRHEGWAETDRHEWQGS
jgi:hypothetical protein